MSKFDYSCFYGGYISFAVNAQKYTKEQAIEIFERETCEKVGSGRRDYTVGEAWTRHRAGRNEDNEPTVGWWVEYAEYQRSCPVWEFHHNYMDDEWIKAHKNKEDKDVKRSRITIYQF